MRLAVIRVAGVQFDTAKYTRQYGFTPDVVWRAGKADHVGRVHADSGFNLTIADANSAEMLVQQIRSWFQENKSALLALNEFKGAAVIDVGLAVGTSAEFTASVRFAGSDLRFLAETGVELSVSAYPAGDDTVA